MFVPVALFVNGYVDKMSLKHLFFGKSEESELSPVQFYVIVMLPGRAFISATIPLHICSYFNLYSNKYKVFWVFLTSTTCVYKICFMPLHFFGLI